MMDYNKLVKETRERNVIRRDPLIQELTCAIEEQAREVAAAQARIQEVEKAYGEVFTLRAQVHSLEKHKDELKRELAAAQSTRNRALDEIITYQAEIVGLTNDLAAARREIDITCSAGNEIIARLHREKEEMRERTIEECAKVVNTLATAQRRVANDGSNALALEYCADKIRCALSAQSGPHKNDSATERNDPLTPEEDKWLASALKEGRTYRDLLRIGLQALNPVGSGK